MNIIELLRSYQNPNFPCNTNSDTINKRYSTRLSENNLEVMYYFINFFRKNHTHVKKMGHTSEFPFDIYLWTLKNLKKQNFEKKKKKKNCWRYHHFTHMCQKPQSYEVQFLRNGVRENFYVILGHFLPFYSPSPPPPFYTSASVPKIMIICYTVPEIWRVTDVIVTHPKNQWHRSDLFNGSI